LEFEGPDDFATFGSDAGSLGRWICSQRRQQYLFKPLHEFVVLE